MRARKRIKKLSTPVSGLSNIHTMDLAFDERQIRNVDASDRFWRLFGSRIKFLLYGCGNWVSCLIGIYKGVLNVTLIIGNSSGVRDERLFLMVVV